MFPSASTAKGQEEAHKFHDRLDIYFTLQDITE